MKRSAGTGHLSVKQTFPTAGLDGKMCTSAKGFLGHLEVVNILYDYPISTMTSSSQKSSDAVTDLRYF